MGAEVWFPEPILLARLYRTLTSLSGQRLFPGVRTEGYEAPYFCNESHVQSEGLKNTKISDLLCFLLAKPRNLTDIDSGLLGGSIVSFDRDKLFISEDQA